MMSNPPCEVPGCTRTAVLVVGRLPGYWKVCRKHRRFQRLHRQGTRRITNGSFGAQMIEARIWCAT